jgi:hypothetical protein
MFLFLGISTQIFAQEDRGAGYDQTLKQQPQQPVKELAREGDSYSFPEGSNDSRVSGGSMGNKDNAASKDTTIVFAPVKPSQITPADKKMQKEDDSVLSFNFLYYIIQRFKLSDMIE